jgi:hypothetical protein
VDYEGMFFLVVLELNNIFVPSPTSFFISVGCSRQSRVTRQLFAKWASEQNAVKKEITKLVSLKHFINPSNISAFPNNQTSRAL